MLPLIKMLQTVHKMYLIKLNTLMIMQVSWVNDEINICVNNCGSIFWQLIKGTGYKGRILSFIENHNVTARDVCVIKAPCHKPGTQKFLKFKEPL